MSSLRVLLVTALLLPACALEGQISGLPGSGDDTPDDTPDAAVDDTPDAAPGPTSLSGKVVDFSAGDPLVGAALSTDGLTPPANMTAGEGGAYSIPELPADATFSIKATMAQNYRPTTNATISTVGVASGTPIARDLYLVSEVYVQRQSATLGGAVAPDTAILVGDLLNGMDQPKTGVPLANITLADAGGQPVVGSGPYFLGATGDVDPLVITSTTYAGHARFAFINLPVGTYTLTVNYGGGAGGGGGGGGGGMGETITQSLAVTATSALLTNVKPDGGGGGGGMGADAGVADAGAPDAGLPDAAP